ncbi:MAG: aminotransferase class IV [Gemmatimonadota bacterium]|nr:aminotransferase class IV [Gemmatimonadota bacterium]
MSPTVYFNGAFVAKDEVRISPDDRGFLFSDGVYEVIRSYEGRLFELTLHLARLEQGLCAMGIAGIRVDSLADVFRRLLTDNGLTTGTATIYLQITRGVAPRTHAFPDPPVPPTVYVEAKRLLPRADPAVGVSVITVPDTRWTRCDIKTVGLLANCMANQRAREAGAIEAVLVRDGVALEATASSVFAVVRDEVRTAPKSNYILPSITREVVLRLCRTAGIAHRETPVFLDELPQASELFLASTTLEVMPIVQVDGWQVAGGRPGPVTRRLVELFQAETARLTGPENVLSKRS